MKFENMKKVIFDDKPVFASIYKEYGEKNWLKYLKKNKVSKTKLTKENLELIKTIEELLTPLLGQEIASNAKKTLEENFFVGTADHHGILCHPFFLNSALARSSQDVRGKNKSTIILSCGGVSLSNSSFPRGVFFHNEKLEEIRIPFVSLKHRRRPVYGLPAISKENIEKAFNKTISKTDGLLERKLEQLKERFLSAKIFEVETYSEQCTIINEILWRETFGGTRGDLVYLEMEKVVVKLLEDIHLKKETKIHKILFDDKVRERYLKNMDGVVGAHDVVKQKGSHLFWLIDGDVRKQLFLQGQSLKVLGEEISIELSPKSIGKLLQENKLLPTMALSFSIISFYHGLTCGGGFSQVQYLGEMKKAYEKTFDKENKDFQNLRTDIFTGEFTTSILGKKKENVSATFLDLFIFGKINLSNKIDEILRNISIKDSLDLMMPEFYKIITGEKIEIENLPKIPPMISTEKERKKCQYCGNNPTNHLYSYIMQSLAVPLQPLSSILAIANKPAFRSFAKIILTPYMWFFRALGMLKFNRDVSKAVTKRSEAIWQEAIKRGIEMEQIVIWNKPLEQYRVKIKNSWKYFESIPLPKGENAPSYEWMDDKAILKKKFLKEKIPVAFGGSVSNFKKALEIFQKAEKPVITKPQLGSRGRHTTTFINTEKDLKHAYNVAKQLCHFVVVEEHLVGSVYRATYIGGEIVGILRGDPPRITGDGKNSIRELIEIKNLNKPDAVKDILISQNLIEFLARQKLSLDDILPSGKNIDLSEKIGISYGGNAIEEFPKTHPKLIAHLKRAGDILNAPVVGFDFIISDATKDPDTQKWGIIEANSLPFINLHHFPLEGKPINVAGKIWDLWKNNI